MSFLTKYGSFWGFVPETSGNVYWVSPTPTYVIEGRTYSASDNNDGLSPERALLTIQYANNQCAANANDVIMLLPGTYTSAAVVNLNRAGITIVGLSPSMCSSHKWRSFAGNVKTNWTSTLAGTAVALTVADVSFFGINFIPVTAQTFMTAVTCPRTSFQNCAVTLSAAVSTSTKGIVFSGGSTAAVVFTNCYLLNSAAASAQGPVLDLSGVTDFLVQDSMVICKGTSSAWAVAIQLGAGSSGLIRNNHIAATNIGTITIGIDGTGVVVANSVMLSNNFYGVSPGAGAVKNLANADASIVQNFYGTAGAGAGFVIQTITL